MFYHRLLDTVPFTMHCYSLDWHPKVGVGKSMSKQRIKKS